MAALLLALLSLFTGFSHASIELSLESNRVERGNIGYVDMEVLFKKFPETIQAKKKFKEELQKAEDQINLEKIGVLHLRQALSELRMERRFSSKGQVAATTAPVAVASAPIVAVSSASATAIALSSVPVATPVAVSSPAAQSPVDQSLISALPGFNQSASNALVRSTPPAAVSTAPKSGVSPLMGPSLPGSSTTVKSQPLFVPTQDVTVSSAAVVQKPAEVIAAKPPSPPAPAPVAKVDLAGLDTRIAAESAELTQKEAALKQDEASIEKNLLNLENRETQGLLGKIYKVIREVAGESGVSVVVDKSQILYGHDAVDLTDKVLKRLAVLKASGGFQ